MVDIGRKQISRGGANMLSEVTQILAPFQTGSPTAWEQLRLLKDEKLRNPVAADSVHEQLGQTLQAMTWVQRKLVNNR